MPTDPLDHYEPGGQPMATMPLEPRPFEELYDLHTDPEEWHNLATDPAHAHVRRDLGARLTQWLIDTNDHALRGEVPVRPEPPGWGDWPIPDPAPIQARLAAACR